MCMPTSVVNRKDGQVKLVLMSRRYFNSRVTFLRSLPPATLFLPTTQSV